jgi:ATP-dependent Lon protease
MYRIQTKGYDKKEKTTIAMDYLLPKIREQVKFTAEDITVPEETIQHIIDSYTDEEKGVRNLKRCLEVVYTKLNLYRLMRPGSNLFEKDMTLEITFPAKVTVDMITKLLKKADADNSKWNHMYT